MKSVSRVKQLDFGLQNWQIYEEKAALAARAFKFWKFPWNGFHISCNFHCCMWSISIWLLMFYVKVCKYDVIVHRIGREMTINSNLVVRLKYIKTYVQIYDHAHRAPLCIVQSAQDTLLIDWLHHIVEQTETLKSLLNQPFLPLHSSPFQLQVTASIRERRHLGRNSCTNVAISGRSRTDAVLCNWKRLQYLREIPHWFSKNEQGLEDFQTNNG